MTVLSVVIRGGSNRQVAKELWVSEQTIKFHPNNIYRKLKVANRTEATRWAFAHGFCADTGGLDNPLAYAT